MVPRGDLGLGCKGRPSLGPPSWQFLLKDRSTLVAYGKRGRTQNAAQCLGPGVKNAQSYPPHGVRQNQGL